MVVPQVLGVLVCPTRKPILQPSPAQQHWELLSDSSCRNFWGGELMAGRGAGHHHVPWEVRPEVSGKTAHVHSLFLRVNRWGSVEAVPGYSAG